MAGEKPVATRTLFNNLRGRLGGIGGLVAACGLVIGGGCNFKPRRVEPPKIDPDGIAKGAMDQADANKDGQLDATELAKIPGIKSALSLFDRNADGKVATDEIAARVRLWQESKTAIASFSCVVLKGGKPLEGATLKFIPEGFMGGAIEEASGKTDAGGNALISIPPEKLPEDQKDCFGVRFGIYRVEISHSEKFDTSIPYGMEIGPDSTQLGAPTIELK